jgi:hypothetical protein
MSLSHENDDENLPSLTNESKLHLLANLKLSASIIAGGQVGGERLLKLKIMRQVFCEHYLIENVI